VPDNPLIFILQCSLQPARVIINFEREQNRHSWAIVTELKKACEIKREPRATKESTFISGWRFASISTAAEDTIDATWSNEWRQISRFTRPEIQDLHSVVVGGYGNAMFGQNH